MGYFKSFFDEYNEDEQNDSLLSYYEKEQMDIGIGGIDQSMDMEEENKSVNDMDHSPLIVSEKMESSPKPN